MLYIGHAEGRASLPQLLKFCTGLTCVPPMGLADPISVSFLRNQPNLILPKADACFAVIKLPTAHSTREMFFNKMDMGILYSLNYYGRI